MSLLKIFDENAFFDRMKEGILFRPSGFSVMLVKEGSIKLRVNGKEASYNEGHIVLISPKNIYKLLQCDENLKLYSLMLLDREALRRKVNLDFNKFDVYRQINVEKNQNILNPRREVFNQIMGLMELLNYHINSEDKTIAFKEQIILGAFSIIVYSLMESLVDEIHPTKQYNSRKEEIAMRFIELVSANFKKERDLSFYANQLNISIKYLSICFKEISHSSPSTFIAYSLLNESKILLLSTNHNISAISANLNFSDQYAFGKFFKKHTGFSPRNYRNQNALVDTI